MTDQENGFDFEGEAGEDIFDFSWRTTTEDVASAEIHSLNEFILNTAKLVDHMCYNNDYDNTSIAWQDLYSRRLGRVSWPQEYYYANIKELEKYMKGGRPTSLSYEEERAFDRGLQYLKDAGQVTKPLDQMMMLMMRVPLLSSFRLVRLTMTLIDEGFDEDFYQMMNTDVKNISDMLNKTDGALEVGYSKAKRYLEANRGRKPQNELDFEYRMERMKDYVLSFKALCARSEQQFRADDYGRFTVDLNMLLLVRVLDQYTARVAEAMKEDISGKLEFCLTECDKLTAVLNARMERCGTDIFRSILTALDVLNNAIKDHCDLTLKAYKSYKDRDMDAPYCFVRKLPAYSSMRPKYGFEPISSDPLDSGSRYERLYTSAAGALTQHCVEYSQKTPGI